ncbi:MAG TPA: ATP-binding protein [Verrucomicrobiae bacterium]|jgi:predicted kinase|nr:ATP-binding protein [Verrucomicrobiae bacterium]
MREPRLYLFIGYPGAGKTTIAQIIARATGAEHLWADFERHIMFTDPTHSHAESVALYEALNKRAEELLAEGKGVVFDTNFNFYEDRQKLRAVADKQHAQTIIIWVTTPKDVAERRAIHAEVTRNGYDFVMSKQQFEDIVAKLEPPTKSEKVIKIDGTKLDEQELMRLLSL